MFHLFISFLLLIAPFLPHERNNASQNYKDAWVELDQNHFREAQVLLLKAAQDPQYRNDALATLMILEYYLGKDGQVIQRYNNPLEQMRNPQAYWFAFWFNDVCLGVYRNMDPEHYENLNYILSHQDLFNGSMIAAAYYFKSIRARFLKNFTEADSESNQIGAIRNWQFTGPFDNLSGSGFDKEYAPISHPQIGSAFTAYNNTKVTWFVPTFLDNNSWVFMKSLFPQNGGMIYAQSFIKSDKDKTCILCLGGAGSLKVWLNDRLLFYAPEERITELDTYKVPCHLNKGYNRVLIQVGYANTQSPNFILRFTDKDYHPISGIHAEPAYHTYKSDTNRQIPSHIPLFAETYFEKKIKEAPDDPINYLLLAKVYLRNQKSYQAQKLIADLLTHHQNNTVILSQYIHCLQLNSDNTEAKEYAIKISNLDPNGIISLVRKESQVEDNKDYNGAINIYDQIEEQTQDTTQFLLSKKINLFLQQNDITHAVTLIHEARQLFPYNTSFVSMLYNYYSKVTNDPASALHLLNDYCDSAFDFSLITALANEYISQGNFEDGITILKTLLKEVPFANDLYNTIAADYFDRKQYDSAISYLEQLNKIGPYLSQPYSDIATCDLQKGDTAQAIQYLQQALACDPAQPKLYNQLRVLREKPVLYSYFPTVDEQKMIEEGLLHPYDTIHHFYYVFDIHNTLIYSKGADEQEVQTAVYINDDKGINRFSDIYVPYNDNFQKLTILKAEVVQKDGSRIPADINDNEIVYSKLGKGDIIYYRYKIRNEGIGRIGREFWDKFYFSAAVPTTLAAYNLLVSDSCSFFYRSTDNDKVVPSISDHDGFKLYSWKQNNIRALEDEVLMPQPSDIGEALYISTIPKWQTIVQWYSDLTRKQIKSDFYTEQAIKELFPNGIGGLSDKEKAKCIYDFIISNITYSSVPFRQSAYIPQKAGKTLYTRLGDCKDMATLFVSMAQEVGIHANLVLVSTRDNGQHTMVLPSMEFNHCIVECSLDHKDYYLELTDKHLPFLALPENECNAQILDIPIDGIVSSSAQPILLDPVNKIPDMINRQIQIEPQETDADEHVNLCVTGALASVYRSTYSDEMDERRKEDLTQNIASIFKRNIDIKNVSWTGLNSLSDTVSAKIEFDVHNEIIKAGDLYLIKPNFMDPVATPNLFDDNIRKYPIEYWLYENTQQYQDKIMLILPENEILKAIPNDAKFDLNDMHYQLTYQKISPHRLLINRSFITAPWKNIAASDYKKLKAFFDHIMDAESTYISYEKR